MCGFIGVIGSEYPVQEIHDGLLAIQHRGQDAAGIVSYDGRFHLRKGEGLVRDVFSASRMKGVTGSIALGHVRYPTVGSGGVEDAQPFVLNHPFGIAMAHNGNVANYEALRKRLIERRRRHLLSKCDVEIILNVFADELSRQSAGGAFSVEVFRAAVSEVHAEVRGAYSVVGFIPGEGLFAFRDPYGIKPICMGKRLRPDGTMAHAVASESVVLETLGYEVQHRPGPGEALLIRPNGEVLCEMVTEPTFRPCIFEFIYFARPDSTLDGVSVYWMREKMGEALAARIREMGITADVVVPVPESARPSALSMALALGWSYREALVKNRYIGRTFIMPGQSTRERSVRQKLNVLASEVRGKSVVIVDDSIVRGTTSRQIIEMVREAGARKVYLASAAPPLRYPCVYGIDMSTRQDFIATDRNDEQIADVLGADAVIYQELPDLAAMAEEAGGGKIPGVCDACFTGEYPTGDIGAEELRGVEEERMSSR